MRRKPERLDAATARSLLDAILPTEGKTLAELEKEDDLHLRLQLALIQGPDSEALAQAHTASAAPGPDGLAAHQAMVALLRKIIREETPELSDQFEQELRAGQFPKPGKQ